MPVNFTFVIAIPNTWLLPERQAKPSQHRAQRRLLVRRARLRDGFSVEDDRVYLGECGDVGEWVAVDDE